MVFKIVDDPDNKWGKMAIDEDRAITMKLKHSGKSRVKEFQLVWPEGECSVLSD